jgi:hypothetical protein
MTPKPLVSCLRSTVNRPPYMLQVIRYFQGQGYSNRAFVIFNNDTKNVIDLVPAVSGRHYWWRNHRSPVDEG